MLLEVHQVGHIFQYLAAGGLRSSFLCCQSLSVSRSICILWFVVPSFSKVSSGESNLSHVSNLFFIPFCKVCLTSSFLPPLILSVPVITFGTPRLSTMIYLCREFQGMWGNQWSRRTERSSNTHPALLVVLGQGCLGGNVPHSRRPSSLLVHVSHYLDGKTSKGIPEGERDHRGGYVSVTSLSSMGRGGERTFRTAVTWDLSIRPYHIRM